MRLRTVFLCATVLLTAGGLFAQDPTSKHEQSIAAIQKLGGVVKVDPTSPDKPVTVTLTGSSNPADCMPHLEAIPNLRACDL